MVPVQVYLDEAMDQWLKQRARERGTSKSAVAREAVRLLRHELAEAEARRAEPDSGRRPGAEGDSDGGDHL